jgi:hypothetical protein
MRRDLHRLFDDGELAVDPATHSIDLRPSLLQFDTYRLLDGSGLHVTPDRVAGRVDQEALGGTPRRKRGYAIAAAARHDRSFTAVRARHEPPDGADRLELAAESLTVRWPHAVMR